MFYFRLQFTKSIKELQNEYNRKQRKNKYKYSRKKIKWFFTSNKKSSVNIKSFQAQVILVEPTNSLTLDVEQSSLKVAEKSNQYKYSYTSKNTEIIDLYSVENGIKINGTFLQSYVAAYEY